MEKSRLTFLPNIWLIAADSFNVHSATTLARISFIYNINAFNGFLICGFFLSLAALSLLFSACIELDEFFCSIDDLELENLEN